MGDHMSPLPCALTGTSLWLSLLDTGELFLMLLWTQGGVQFSSSAPMEATRGAARMGFTLDPSLPGLQDPGVMI